MAQTYQHNKLTKHTLNEFNYKYNKYSISINFI